jgi:hypothetical protein
VAASSWLLGNQNAAREQAGSNPELLESSQGAASGRCIPGRGRPFRQGQSGNPGGARAFPHKTWPLARDILHKTVLANQAPFEQKLGEVMLTKKGALQVLELLAKLNREIGSRADEGPAVRIVIGGNIPLDGMKADTPPALLARDPDAIPDP